MDVDRAVEQAQSLIDPQAKCKRGVVATSLAEGLPLVPASRNHLEQVIMNLEKNSVDAMPNGGFLTLSSALTARGPQAWGRPEKSATTARASHPL